MSTPLSYLSRYTLVRPSFGVSRSPTLGRGCVSFTVK